MKYKTIGAFKNVQNVGNCKADTDLKVGMGVILDRVAKTAKLPSSDAEAKACHRIVTNINDKPEIPVLNDWNVIKKGEFVRADDLTTVANLEAELAKDEISTDFTTIAVGDKLVFGTDGLFAKATDVDGYKVFFEVIEKTAYMGAGVLAIIRVQ